MGESNSSVAPARDFAATIRGPDGRFIATTWGGAMCKAPRKPGSLRVVNEDFEHVLRCGECEGCIEFNRQRLADRVRAYFDGKEQDLWIVRLSVPLEGQSAFCNRLHRRPLLELEPWIFRLSTSCVAVVARAKAPIKQAYRNTSIKPRVAKVQRARGRRAWRDLTGGLAVPREAWGENTNRYYARGLPPAEKQTWKLNKISYRKGYNRLTSPRASWGDGSVLVPPQIWQLRRNARRAVFKAMRSATDDAAATRIIQQAVALIPPGAQQYQLNAAPQGRLTREQVQAWYRDMAERKAASATSGSALFPPPPLSEVGGYKSSVQSTSTETPKLLSDEQLREVGPSGKERWRERELGELRTVPDQRAQEIAKTKAVADAFEAKMLKLAKERESEDK